MRLVAQTKPFKYSCILEEYKAIKSFLNEKILKDVEKHFPNMVQKINKEIFKRNNTVTVQYILNKKENRMYYLNKYLNVLFEHYLRLFITSTSSVCLPL